MRPQPPKAVWTMDITVKHHPDFGHEVVVQVLGQRDGWFRVGRVTWQGLGIPPQVLEELRARVDACLSDHLVSRYGIQGEIPVRWAGESGDF